MMVQGAGGPPQFIRIAVTDYYTAALATQAVLAALVARGRSGQGQHVETSLLHGVLALQAGDIVHYPGRPPRFRESPTYRLYQAGDGEWFFLACGNQSFWVKLCKALDLEPLADDPRFASWRLRSDHRDALQPLLEERFRTRPRSEWLATLAARDIPAAPVQTLEEFLADPAVRHHGMVREYDHPEVGRLRLMGLPLAFSDTPTEDPGPPPALGQHTDEVLTTLGYATDAIADLRRRAIVG
jgi:glutaryl-CoA transferase